MMQMQHLFTMQFAFLTPVCVAVNETSLSTHDHLRGHHHDLVPALLHLLRHDPRAPCSKRKYQTDYLVQSLRTWEWFWRKYQPMERVHQIFSQTEWDLRI